MSAKKLVFLALFTALDCVVTWVLPIPTGLGNVNFADAVCFLAIALFGFPAIVVGSVGGFLADLLTGYASFAPFTLVVKACMGLVAALLLSAWKKRCPETYRKHPVLAFFTSFISGGIVMVAGYFCTNWILTGSALAALSGGVPFDLLQAAFCTAFGTALAVPFTKNAALSRFFGGLL